MRLMTAFYSCTQCKATFGRLAHLRRHQKIHRAEKPYVCQFCPLASSRKDVVVRHTKNFHRDQMLSAHVPQRSLHDHSDGSSQGHPSLQHPLQLDRLTDTGFECPVDLDVSSFETHDFCETGLEALTAPQALQSPDNVFSNSVAGDDQPHLLFPNFNPSLAHPWDANREEADYAIAHANLALYDLTQIPSDFRFPSQHAVRRSVHAFLKHMAPHIPIIHKPTFSIASVASPLLIEIVACGALYLGEHTTAAIMNATAQRLMFQVTQHESYSTNERFQLWMLQTYLLISCFGAYGGDQNMPNRSTNVFPYALKLTQDALKELEVYPALTYEDWVYRETISRCIASTGEIGASLASTDQCLTVPFLDASFPLPSSMVAWHEEESTWNGHPQQENSSQALNMIFSGHQPTSCISEFGLSSLVSMLLWRICSFKSLTSSHPFDSYIGFVEKVERAINVFDSMLQNQVENDFPHPLFQSARLQLDMAVYHLYGSKVMTGMQQLLDSPTKVNLTGCDIFPKVQLALDRAASFLQSVCQQGICYLKKMAPHHFSPVCAIASYEAGLLLAWYLTMKPPLSSGLALNAKLEKLFDDALIDVAASGEVNHYQRARLPLVLVAHLLSDRSVWHWPHSVSAKLLDSIRPSGEFSMQARSHIESNDTLDHLNTRSQSQTLL
ncbi:hypothetical protein ACN47E_007352 [Coniothyrium glycines]